MSSEVEDIGCPHGIESCKTVLNQNDVRKLLSDLKIYSENKNWEDLYLKY